VTIIFSAKEAEVCGMIYGHKSALGHKCKYIYRNWKQTCVFVARREIPVCDIQAEFSCFSELN